MCPPRADPDRLAVLPRQLCPATVSTQAHWLHESQCLHGRDPPVGSSARTPRSVTGGALRPQCCRPTSHTGPRQHRSPRGCWLPAPATPPSPPAATGSFPLRCAVPTAWVGEYELASRSSPSPLIRAGPRVDVGVPREVRRSEQPPTPQSLRSADCSQRRDHQPPVGSARLGTVTAG